MKIITLMSVALSLLVTTGAFADSFKLSGVRAATSKAEFCKQAAKNPHYFQSLLLNEENIMAFTNEGGLLNGGVCWWHSRLTRNATYMAIYRPDLPRPSDAEVDKILSKLKSGNSVVEIPGYRNFREFTSDYRTKIQGLLESWQITHGVLGLGFVGGNIGGLEGVDPALIDSIMDRLYERIVKRGQVVYQYLQMPGVVAHAWLVVDMVKTKNGYDLKVVDSNYLNPTTVSYVYGQTMQYAGWYPFNPYINRTTELWNIVKTVEKYCKIKMEKADDYSPINYQQLSPPR
ncbi:hypothetical protein [Bdellovibrio sp. ArHS]|uniref:hypothetical protein n=1 Tax=Bdellovibrio sp. ArHS TaxID=1569284 RepID=UPI0025B9FF32|nr:hypothetical protein [Bdellovibrio sp. ArHS]